MASVDPNKDEAEEGPEEEHVARMPYDDDDDDDDDDDKEEEEDDDLILEGVLVRNPDVSSSSDDDDDEDGEHHDEEQSHESGEKKVSPKAVNQDSHASATSSQVDDKKTQATPNSSKQQKESRKRKKSGPEIVHVEFEFWDMKEKFFHGLKTLLDSSSPIYAARGYSSALADLMIENVAVGTVVSTEGDEEGIAYGFASVLNVTTYGSQECIQHLKTSCLDNCPPPHKAELETVLSGKTKRPAGFLLHSRMINLPLEIVLVLHQQLVLDMDWAVEHAEGGEDERKSLDFGAFVRLAPATPGEHGSLHYKYFDDEIFANNAEFVYTVNAPKSFGSEVKQLVSVIVMTKTGHRDAMKELEQLVGSQEQPLALQGT